MRKKKTISGGKRVGMLPPIGNFSSRREWENAAWRKVVESRKLMQLLLTPYERHDLVMRAAVLEALASGKLHRQISREFFVSLQTINAVKKAMGENGYRSYLDRSKTERKKRDMSTIPSAPRRSGAPHRTKYGTVYLH